MADQRIEAILPEGFHIMAMESSITNKGAMHYRVYMMRSVSQGQFQGGQGFTLQEAVDAAMQNLRDKIAKSDERMAQVAPVLTPRPIMGLTLDLSRIKR